MVRALPYLVAILALLGALFGAYRHGVTVTTDEYEGRLATIQAQHTAALADEQAKARKAEQDAAARMAAIDQQHEKEMRDVQAKADRTIAAVRADAIRVRERFTCPTPAAGSAGAQAGASASVGDAATQRGLSAEDIELVLRIAAEADEVAVQLKALQDIVRSERQ